MTTPQLLGLIDATLARHDAHNVYVAYRAWELARDEAVARHTARESLATPAYLVRAGEQTNVH